MNLEERHRWWKSRGRRELREVLMAHWDPIGVSGAPEAQDEYDAYLAPLANLLHDGAGIETVARYLSEVQTEQMDLPVMSHDLRDVAAIVVRWYSEAQC
jgi:hypothetical protein